MRPALKVLRDEHLALSGIAKILKADAKLLAQGKDVDAGLLDDIIVYIQTYTNQIHHPKEEDFLFAVMRLRSADSASMLNRLHQEHEQEAVLIKDLAAAAAAYGQDKAKTRARIAAALSVYGSFLERHITAENEEVFPLAQEILTDADWDEIDAVFILNEDPLVGSGKRHRFEALYQRIMSFGLGPI